MGDEAAMLAAYAGHAAAALDLIIALEDARQEAERAGALLDVAHELAAADSAAAIAVVGEALPRIVGCTSAGILLWDAAGRIAPHVVGVRHVRRAGPRSSRRRSGRGRPELVGMLTDRAPRIIHERDEQPGAPGAAARRRHRGRRRRAAARRHHVPRRRHGRLERRGGAGGAGRRRPRAAPGCRRPGHDGAAEGPAARDRPAPGDATTP